MVVEIALCAVIVDQFSNLVSFVVSIIMLVSGYCLSVGPTMLYYVFSGHLMFPAYVTKIKFNNNNVSVYCWPTEPVGLLKQLDRLPVLRTTSKPIKN